MPIYRYVKTKRKIRIRPPLILSLAMMLTGFLIISYVSWPIISFQFITHDLFTGIISPIADTDLAKIKIENSVLAAPENTSQPAGDFTNPNDWYPASPQKKVAAPVQYYMLSIPKLNIRNAKVVIAGDSLDTNLIHYGGTALPGENGTSVIFGHSTLPQLYDPTNYKTIFSFLPTLKPVSDTYPGDEIIITYDNMIYKYLVYDMVIKKPTDLSVLDQDYDGSYLTLVTCVPPGTYWERLNVRAKLVAIQ